MKRRSASGPTDRCARSAAGRRKSQASPRWQGEIEEPAAELAFFAAGRQRWAVTARAAGVGAIQVGKIRTIKHLSGGAAAWLEWPQQSQRIATVGTAKRLSHCRLLIGDWRLAVVAGQRLLAVSGEQLPSLH